MRQIGLIVFLFSTNWCWGQDLPQTMELGLMQYREQNYQAASATFERVIYFDSLGQFAPQAQWHLAKCLAAMHKTNPALLVFDQAKVMAHDSVEMNEIALEKALFLTTQKAWLKALVELYQLQNLSPEQFRTAEYLKGTALFAINDLEKAQKAFENVVPEKNRPDLETLFKDAHKKLDPKRIRRAEYWSLFIPGTGQFLSGNMKGGINSLLLLGGLWYLYYNTVNNYGIISGLMTVFPLYARYHAGGMENAGMSMKKRQERLRSIYFDQITELMSESE